MRILTQQLVSELLARRSVASAALKQSAVAVPAKAVQLLTKSQRGTGDRSPPLHLLISVLGVSERCSGHLNVFR